MAEWEQHGSITAWVGNMQPIGLPSSQVILVDPTSTWNVSTLIALDLPIPLRAEALDGLATTSLGSFGAFGEALGLATFLGLPGGRWGG